MLEIHRYTINEFVEIDDDQQMTDDLHNWSDLWFDEWDQTDIEEIYLCWDDNDIVAFQTVNLCGLTTAIEVKEGHRGQGIARLLIEKSGSCKPDRNANPLFWGKIESE